MTKNKKTEDELYKTLMETFEAGKLEGRIQLLEELIKCNTKINLIEDGS